MSEGRTMAQLATSAPRHKPRLTESAYNEIHRIVDAARAGSTEVKVSKEALRNLLEDHAELAAFYQHFKG